MYIVHFVLITFPEQFLPFMYSIKRIKNNIEHETKIHKILKYLEHT